MNAYSEWLEGLGAECSLSVAFIFAGDIFGIRVSWPKALWMLQLLVALPSKRPALGPQPRTLANDRARFFAKKKKTKLIFHRNKGFVLSHLWLRLQGGAGKERFPQQSPNCWPQGRGGAGGGEREPVTEKTWRGWRRFHHPGGKQE